MDSKIIQVPHGFCNVAIYNEYAPTITTSCWECNNFLIEERMDKKIVSYSRDSKGVVAKHHLRDTANTLCVGNAGKDRNTAQFVAEGVNLPAISVHPLSHKLEFYATKSIKSDASPALRATDYKAPHCAYIDSADKITNINPSQSGINGNVYSNRGLSPTLTTNKGEGVKMLNNFRIRKLTPRECFRLMGVADKDIDTIQAAGISNAQQYKMAGNSIVVDVLYEIFRKAFVEQENENQQLTLFFNTNQ